ncbi:MULTISPECIES: hypothetical protein [Achromobacter]|uniref:Uncharacterized protein n=1 Tax=Achromobacter spanius TaxID=217203 RepID=A0ABY8H1A2_9BURK|nr:MULTISPECIES: hypothetical protein [Achromobacter]WAI85659.1 hypothetical protein N8Z00_11530 [Achromobacter spanius]WEX95741.1 hypothetical protein N3Z32_06120 [Achromobacter sp. SS2-2022]WFP10539.1 hypothetical protein P8T11_11960 [Achromobacter spanius]
MHSPVMAMAFSLFVLCFITCTLSGIVLFFFKCKEINARLKHPYLQHRPWAQYPLSIQAAIMLDYFFRLMFPGTRLWLIGNANDLLGHVDPKQTPLSLKWPIVGFWGSCWLGLIAMIVLWVMLFLGR